METEEEKDKRYDYLFQRGWLSFNEVRILRGEEPLSADLSCILMHQPPLPDFDGITIPETEAFDHAGP